jgi:D-alanyl-D-alanine carboxypeptidase (penicillin-binding protein 5/6)
MVLKKYPLTGTEQGPTYTFTDNDVNIYNSYAAEGGSVVYIVDGETITEHQMLEAMLLPSGNNIADTMAIWAYGSLSAYATAANQFLDEQGITHTHVGVDASGYDPSSTSTPADLVKIGELVMQNSALKDIVAEPSTNDIPGIGTAYNVDTLIGQDGIVGIKTGNNDQDLGVFVGASNQSVGGKNIVILTATMGQASLANAFNSTQALVSSSVSNIKGVTLVPSGTEIGAYVGGNTNVPIVAASDLSAEVWGGGIVVSRPSKVDNITNPTADHTKVGNMVVTGQVLASSPINLVTNQSYNKPTLTWKLLHPGSVKF